MKKTLIPFRIVIVLAIFLLTLLLYIDRVCISAAKSEIASDLDLSDTQMGWVLSAFAFGYALFQIPGGWLADRFGPRGVLSSIVVIWSLFTAFTGMAWNYISLLLTRVFFGMGEAGAFPGISKAVFNWFPVKERGLVNGINFSGSRIGAALALPLVAWLIGSIGWRETFYVLGAIGVVWALIWLLVFRNRPMQQKLVSERELAYIQNNRQVKNLTDDFEEVNWKKVRKSSNVWLTSVQYFASNFVFFFCLSWLFPYLKNKYQLELTQTGIYASLPFVAGAVGNWLSGGWSDYLYAKGKWTLSRRLPAITGFSLVIIGVFLSLQMSTILAEIICLSIAIMGADMTLSPSWSFCIDIGKRKAGTISGIMNMAGNVGSFITALAFPYLREWTNSDIPFFYTAIVLSGIGIVAWLKMKPQNNVSE